MESVTATSSIRCSSFIQSSININGGFSQQISLPHYSHPHTCFSTSHIKLRSLIFRPILRRRRSSHCFICCSNHRHTPDDPSSDRIAVLLEVDGFDFLLFFFNFALLVLEVEIVKIQIVVGFSPIQIVLLMICVTLIKVFSCLHVLLWSFNSFYYIILFVVQISCYISLLGNFYAIRTYICVK